MSVSINYHNQNLNDICMICHESYDSSSCYILPECGHKFHTNCIITWFRNGDSRCPYCGDKGINNVSKKNSFFYNYGTYENQYINDVKKVISNDIDNVMFSNIIKKISKLKILEDKKNKNLNEKRDYEKFIKVNTVNYNETKKKLYNFKRENEKLSDDILREKFKIVNNSYIIPLILPIKLNL